jgi:hypothetical protein
MLAEAIDRNRAREARRNRAERVLRAVRLRVFDYQDAGLEEKASKVMDTCKRILAPRWNPNNTPMPGTATAHKGPKGGVEYRLWTGPDTYRVVGKYAARPHMSPAELDKAASMEQANKAKREEQARFDAGFRWLQRGG